MSFPPPSPPKCPAMLMHPLPRLESLPTSNDFVSRYLRPPSARSVPVVFPQPCKDTFPARSWTIDNLVGCIGKNLVHVRTNTSNAEYREGDTIGFKKQTFSQYVHNLRNKTLKAPTGEYLAAQNIKTVFPQIVHDIAGKLPFLRSRHPQFKTQTIPCAPENVGEVHKGPYLWLASKNHYEFNHYDPDDNFLYIIEGVKHVRIMSPSGAPSHMRKKHATSNYSYENVGSEKLKSFYPRELGKKGRAIQSRVDLDKPDIRRFPLFKQLIKSSHKSNPLPKTKTNFDKNKLNEAANEDYSVEWYDDDDGIEDPISENVSPDLCSTNLHDGNIQWCWEGDVRAGECLYIPAFFWHQITSITECLSVNCFFGDLTKTKNNSIHTNDREIKKTNDSLFLAKILRTDSVQHEAFAYWLCNIIAQNQYLKSFERVLLHLPSSLRGFCVNQWGEENSPSPAQLEQMVKIVMQYCKIADTELAKKHIIACRNHDYMNIQKINAPVLKIRGLKWRSDKK